MSEIERKVLENVESLYDNIFLQNLDTNG